MDAHQITSADQLTALMGEAHDFVKAKVTSELDPEMREFIASSSLVFISTIDAQGNPDVSPKGDPAGFVKVASDSLIHIPDRPGNKLLFGFRNLLENPSIGILFVTPNTRETLRIKGKAVISNDPELLGSMSVGGKPALLVTSINIEECFFHCGKAMIRSKVWDPESWEDRGKSIIARQAARKMQGDKELEIIIESELEKNYKEELY